LGSISLIAGDFAEAVSLGEKAVSLGPSDADAAALLADTLTYTGDPERALALIDRAIRLRPNPPRWYYWLSGRANRLAGRFDRAAQILEVESRAERESFIPLVELAATYGQTQQLALAAEARAEVLRRSPAFTIRSWVAMPPYRDPTMRDLEIAALRAAGLPD
jgi:adenylate cyclase